MGGLVGESLLQLADEDRNAVERFPSFPSLSVAVTGSDRGTVDVKTKDGRVIG